MRHGQSTWNAEGRFQGQAPGVGLTAIGRRQALDAAARVAAAVGPAGPSAGTGFPGTVGARGGMPVRIVSSDLERAVATAEPIGRALGVGVHPDPDLREQAGGVLEGRLTRELVAEPTPPGAHVHEVRWGGGESIEDVWLRVSSFVERARAWEGTLVVVSHGGTLQALRAVLDGRSWREVTWHDELGNGEVLVIDSP